MYTHWCKRSDSGDFSISTESGTHLCGGGDGEGEDAVGVAVAVAVVRVVTPVTARPHENGTLDNQTHGTSSKADQTA